MDEVGGEVKNLAGTGFVDEVDGEVDEVDDRQGQLLLATIVEGRVRRRADQKKKMKPSPRSGKQRGGAEQGSSGAGEKSGECGLCPEFAEGVFAKLPRRHSFLDRGSIYI